MTHTAKDAPPISRLTDLSDLTEAGREIEISAEPEELIRLAAWAGVESVNAFHINVLIRRRTQTRFSLSAEFSAEIVQKCVVTLEPVVSAVSLAIRRDLQWRDQRLADPCELSGGELTLAAGDEETPDEIETLRYDLCAPVLEEFSLAIDPYPRKTGAVYTPAAEAAEPSENPFAVLADLKKTLEP